MKKISRYIFLIGALVLFIGLSPRFLALDKAQKTITEQLSKKLGSPVTVQNMHWAWLPFPHLSLTDTKFRNEYSVFSVPEMRIYPNWGIIFNQEVILGSIHLKSPEIFIDKSAFQAEKSPKFTIPEISVYINNGILKIEASENLKEILLEDTHIFSNINGLLKMEHQNAELNLHVSSPFSRSITLQGDFNNNTRNYNLFLDFQDIKLHKSINSLFNGILVPVKSTGRLAGNITGTGLQEIEANLHGTVPSFRVKQKDREILLTPGFADFTFLKSGPLTRLTVKDLEMKEPRLNLSGLIKRKLSTGSNDLELQATGAEPIWTLDLAGNDLDLTAIRHKVLTLWEDNEVAKTVCDIVLGGEARTAAYRFTGKTADFEDLDSMIIEADVLDADIHVPGAELDLTKGNGPILIEESILTGHNLRAQMGNSFGSKAELLLDLAEEGNAFTLNIDIDADLEALPPVLEQLVEHNGFLEELSKFKEVSGRAKGKLRLGDTLDNIITRVDIRNMQFATRYTPIPQTIYIDKGILHVGPADVNWQKVKGRIGLQEILNTSGNVSWKTGDTLLDITEIQGQLDGESLYAMLEQTGVMPEKIKSSLLSLHGSIDVTKGSLTGHAQEPETWSYQLAVNAGGANFSSPLLPGPVTVNTVSAAVNDKIINIQQAEVNFLDQPLSLKGTLNHQELENWNGMVEFNGPVQAKLTDWVNSKGWVPEKLRTRTPATLENMSVSFKEDTIAVSGKILNGLTGARMPMVKIDLINTPEYLRINELSFFAPGEQGSLALEFRYQAPKAISLSWQGIVSADTIDALFVHNAFTGGTFNGAFFEISYFSDQPENTRFQGLLKAENLLLKGSSEKEPAILRNVLLNGTGKQLRISALKFDVGTEKMTGFGHLAAGQKGLLLDVDFTSSFISKKSLDNLTQGLKETQRTFVYDRGEELEITKYLDLTGRIGFDFDSFSTSRNITTLNTETQLVNYTLYDAHAELQLVADGLTRTEIFSSKLCGLDYKATWFSNDDLGQHFAMKTVPDTTLHLENVLPCLGVPQDLIEGEFSLQANLRKESGKWHSGNIHIKSTKGRILRLQLLSRIFMIVNITDLFITQTGTTGKKGFPFSQLDIDTHISENHLFFDRAILHGEGLNLFLQGDLHLADYDSDMSLLIAPFKSFDTLVSKVPLIGKPLMSEYNSLLAIPVAIKGPLVDPFITPLHPEAVGGALFNVVKGTLKLPYNILNPPKEEKEPDKTNTEKEN